MSKHILTQAFDGTVHFVQMCQFMCLRERQSGLVELICFNFFSFSKFIFEDF